MKIALIVFFNLVAVAIVAFAIYRLEAQEFALRLHLPKYPKLTIDGAEKVDKKILINGIDELNQQYEHTESVYKKALNTRKSIIQILIITLLSEVALLSITLIVFIRKFRMNDKIITQQTRGADGV